MNHRRLLRAAFLLPCALVLACTTEEERPALTRQQLLDPESCKDCHPKHYEEWSSSMHAYASIDPVFRAMNARGQEDAQLGAFCVNCHAPMAVRENAITDFADLSTVPKHLQGVTCYFCHNAVSVGEPHSNANIQLANDTVMRAALRNAVEPYAHKVAYSRHHDPGEMESSVMCGTCHDITLPNGYHLERTFKEYLSSVNAKPEGFNSCQDCHMEPADGLAAEYPGVGQRVTHSHLFPAVDVALTPDWPNQDIMRRAVENCELQQRSLTGVLVQPGQSLPGEPYSFKVLLETAAAHNMPSGVTSDRRMWLEVVAFDAQGNELLRTAEIADGELEVKPDDDPNFCIFRDYILDAQGNEVHMFWEAAMRDESRSKLLPPSTMPGVPHYGECSYVTDKTVLEPPARIDIHVRMRPMGVDVLQDLVGSGHLDPTIVQKMPTFTVTRQRATWDPMTRRYSMADLSEDDCDTHVQLLECRLNPGMAGCAQ